MYLKGFNPILPLDEYIPDGEPHVFGERIYLFGSHDTEGGLRYCAEESYVGWSAPLSDPADWRYEGVIYEAVQDPCYTPGECNDLYAPDVVQGNDGRYYLYYCFGGADGYNRINVAVCDMPAGRYEYLGYVKNPDGSVHHEYLMGDPAVINDDGVIRVYCGWSLSMVAAGAHKKGKGFDGEEKQYGDANGQDKKESMLPKPGDPAMNLKMAPVYQMMFHRSLDEVKDLEYPLMGANTFTLEDDMMTVNSKVRRIVPGQFDTPKDSSFYGHAFYEASSIRKIDGTYYFIYSSENSNELCYATSQFPDRDFIYGGTIISNGDVGYRGRKAEDRTNMTANDHGSLACIHGQWYIFHHRQTHRSTFSRQACAEPVTIGKDGSIAQVECTSMGFRGQAIPTEGVIPAVVSCVLTNGHMPHATNITVEEEIPYIANLGEERFITGIVDQTVIGYKYFAFNGPVKLTITYRGKAEGKMLLYTGEKDAADDEWILQSEAEIRESSDWMTRELVVSQKGDAAVYFKYEGKVSLDFLQFAFQ